MIEGWQRRFWQASPDHRGTPESPGRVVTLVPVAGARCWGMVYRIVADLRAQVLTELDHRERAGYQRIRVPAHSSAEQEAVTAVVYVAAAGNENYVGPETLESTAQVVRRARGPSGYNRDYLLRLVRTLGEMHVSDSHVTELARVVAEGPPPKDAGV